MPLSAAVGSPRGSRPVLSAHCCALPKNGASLAQAAFTGRARAPGFLLNCATIRLSRSTLGTNAFLLRRHGLAPDQRGRQRRRNLSP